MRWDRPSRVPAGRGPIDIGLGIEKARLALTVVILIQPGDAHADVQCEFADASAQPEVDVAVGPVHKIARIALGDQAQSVELVAHIKAEREPA